MLHLVGFDLDVDSTRKPAPGPALEKGIRECGTGVNFRFGPWLLAADKSPRRVLKRLKKHLNGKGFHDHLLVVPLEIGSLGGPSSDDRTHKPDRKKKKVPKGKKIVVVAYHMHHARSRDYEAVNEAIPDLFDDCCNPVHTVWFVRSPKSAKQVRTLIEKKVPLSCHDDLLVAGVERHAGVCTELEAPRKHGASDPAAWLESHHVATLVP